MGRNIYSLINRFKSDLLLKNQRRAASATRYLYKRETFSDDTPSCSICAAHTNRLSAKYLRVASTSRPFRTSYSFEHDKSGTILPALFLMRNSAEFDFPRDRGRGVYPRSQHAAFSCATILT